MKLPLSLFLVLAVLSVLAAGCDLSEETNTVAPTPTEPVVLQLGGGCDADGTTIFCRDETTPREHVRSVTWRFKSANVTLAVRSGQEVDYTVDAAGDYAVEHEVVADDGAFYVRTLPVAVPG